MFRRFNSRTTWAYRMGLQARHGSGRHKIVSVEDAVHLIPDAATITVGGFVTQGGPEEVLAAIKKRFVETGHPKDLTLLFTGGPGDYGTRGLNHLAVPGLLKRAIGSHYGQTPLLGALVQENKIEAYNLPMGSICRMIRAAGNNTPGHITTIGMGTFVDPKFGGGKLNDRTTEDLVVEIEILGKKYLLYKMIPIDVAIVRGTTADPDGNITMERESLYADHMVQAMSARARRGVVIAQVSRIAANGSLDPHKVIIPGTMVDTVVVAKKENHWMSYVTEYDPSATGEIRAQAPMTSMELDDRKIIARRGIFEIGPNQVLNLGIGMPEGVAVVAQEENVLNFFEITTEPGVHGGVGLSGHDFGPATNFDARLHMGQQFDFYNGGGLDVCFLGMASVDVSGNVNVTRVGNKLTGPGGFIDITQSTKRVNFMGTFTAGAKVACESGNLKIKSEGSIKKFVNKIPEVTFSAKEALKRGQIIKYITERAVFALTHDGLELVEVAPGIDIQKQIVDQMEFKPIIREPRTMRQEIYVPDTMGVRKTSFGLNIAHRLTYDAATNTVFVNLEYMYMNNPEDIKEFFTAYKAFFQKCTPEGKSHAIIAYDHFDCRAECMSLWQQNANQCQKDHYLSVRRYSGSTFSRHQLSASLKVNENDSHNLNQAIAECRRFGITEGVGMIEAMFSKFDTNGDGKLQGAEFIDFIATLRGAAKNHFE